MERSTSCYGQAADRSRSPLRSFADPPVGRQVVAWLRTGQSEKAKIATAPAKIAAFSGLLAYMPGMTIAIVAPMTMAM